MIILAIAWVIVVVTVDFGLWSSFVWLVCYLLGATFTWQLSLALWLVFTLVKATIKGNSA